ncbi:hypothetical protein [Silvanigrella sp.]|uniref:hypothetical protein n=1 Tax=Silvanigrella sp. TaxID=2024976 RepID=UPI0037C629F4
MGDFEALNLSTSQQIENSSQEAYLKKMGNNLISQIKKSYETHKMINMRMNVNSFDIYEKNVLFYYLNSRYFGFIDNSLANHILYSLSLLKNDFPNIFEILVDPTLIIKKHLFESFLIYCKNYKSTSRVNNWTNVREILIHGKNKFNEIQNMISQNDIWIVRSQFRKTLPQKDFYRALGLNDENAFPVSLMSAVIRNIKNIEYPKIDLLEYFKKNKHFNNFNFLKSSATINNIVNLFDQRKKEYILNDAKRKAALKSIFSPQLKNEFFDIVSSYFKTIDSILSNSTDKIFLHNYIMPISVIANFRVSPAFNNSKLLFLLSGILPSKESNDFNYSFFLSPGKKISWMKDTLKELGLDPQFLNSNLRFKAMDELKKLDPLQSISQFRQVSMSVASTSEQSGQSFSYFKLYRMRLTELDYFSEAQTNKMNFETENFERLKGSLEDFVLGPICKDMIAESRFFSFDKENRGEKYDLYAKVIRRRNPELHKNYTELTSNGVLKRTSLEADYERSAKRKFTNQDLKYFEELIQREE